MTRVIAAVVLCVAAAEVQAQSPSIPDPPNPPAQAGTAPFTLGEIVYVLGKDPGSPGIGGSVITREQLQTFERTTLDQAINLVSGVNSNQDSNGRRNEADIFVRGFGRQQVPLLVDGVRIYLPADNRIDFGRFLTADVAAIQIQKGYASVLDGPGGMGGTINLVTLKPTKSLEIEGGVSAGGRDVEGWNAFAIVGSKQQQYYFQGSVTASDRDSWSLSGDYQPMANSLQPRGERRGSATQDWRANVKFGFTPNANNEYVLNYTKQSGEKGAPLNVYNNPPVPGNGFWRWPYWDIQNTSILTTTQLGASSYLKAKAYYNTFENGLDAYDDITYTTQSANGRFRSPYDDHAYGTSIEFGTTPIAANTLKAAFHYRTDVHTEQQISRPTHPTLSTTEPEQEQSQYTWSIAVEDTFRINPQVDVVAGVSYDKYRITKAEEFTLALGLFDNPKGGADAVNGQAALVWRHARMGEWHASISDRSRFPVIFELYSTRFGTATPNPNLGPERATNIEFGWTRDVADASLSAAVFYSNVRNLIQTVVLADTTTQTQNVGNGDFSGFELSVDVPIGRRVRAGGHYTFVHRDITDALLPNLRPTGVPNNRAFLWATWQPIPPLRVTPSLELAGDRWSDINPAPDPSSPYIKTGEFHRFDLDATYEFARRLQGAQDSRTCSTTTTSSRGGSRSRAARST